MKHQASFVLRVAMLPLALLALIGLASLLNKRLILVGVGLAVVWVAATFWQFPFATPQTVSLLDMRRSVTLTRTLAAGLALLGVILAGAGWWLSARVA